MKKRVRIKDVAERAGVSTGTVDRVIHNRGKVATKVKEKVLAVMEELGFERNLIASALAKNESYRVIAFLPNYKEDPYWEQPYRGIEEARKQVQHYGLNIEYVFFELLNPADFRKKAEQVLHTKPDGLLFPPLFLREGKWLLEQCDILNITSVIFNTNISDAKKLSYIGQDSYQSGVLAARLFNFGASEKSSAVILNLTKGSTNAKHLLQKKQGFEDYFKAHTEKEVQILNFEFEEFNEPRKLNSFLQNLIQEYPDIAGIFFTNSRAYKAIDCTPSSLLKSIKIIGFDLVAQNLTYLHSDHIHFLINQNPIEQGFLGVQSLYKYFILKESIEPIQYLPLDIIVKENVQYYQQRGYTNIDTLSVRPKK